MVLERRHRAGAEVRDRADVEHDLPRRQLPDERRVLDGTDPVADPVRVERLERAPHRGRPDDLARVGHRREPFALRVAEDVRVRLRRELRLEPSEPDPGEPVRERISDRGSGLVLREAAGDVRGERDLDPVQLAGLVGAVAEAGEDLVPGDAAADALRRGEDPLDVDRAVRGRLRCVVDDDLAEVVGLLERVRGQDPDLDEVREVPELVELSESLHCVGGERVVVPPRDLEQRLRPHRPLEVDVQLDLRVRHEGSTAASSRAAQRRSISTASQIVPS